MVQDTPSPLAARLRRFADRADAHPAVMIGLLLLFYVAYALRRSMRTPLWHDELFTYTISKLPTLHELFHWINSVDMNPPLSYLLTRASFHLFGVGTLQTRLPNICGFALALFCLYVFVRRVAGPTWGILAAALLFVTPSAELSIQARPYGLTLGFGALALVGWQGSLRTSGRAYVRSLLLMAAALCCLLLSHVFGLLAWASIAVGELANVIVQRRLNWARAAALLLPLGCTMLYLPYFALHAHTLYPPAFQPHPFTWYQFYSTQAMDPVISLILSITILFLLRSKQWLQGRNGATVLSPAEWWAVAALTLMPAVLILDLMLKHGTFVPRYGAVCTLGIPLVLAVYLQWQSDGRRAMALLTAVVAIVFTLRFGSLPHFLVKPKLLVQTEPEVLPTGLETLSDPSIPIVANSGLTFVEMNFREPAPILARTFYLTNGPAAANYAHATIFEIMAEEKQLFHFKGNVALYDDFIQQHPRFYVIGTDDFPEDWLLRKLAADGADVILRRPEIEGSYRDHHVFEVRITPQAVAAANAQP